VHSADNLYCSFIPSALRASHSITAITGAHSTTLRRINSAGNPPRAKMRHQGLRHQLHAYIFRQTSSKQAHACLTAVRYWSAQGIYKTVPGAHRKNGAKPVLAHKACIRPNSMIPHASVATKHAHPATCNCMLHQMCTTTRRQHKETSKPLEGARPAQPAAVLPVQHQLCPRRLLARLKHTHNPQPAAVNTQHCHAPLALAAYDVQ
jgi:hypothetical protein